MEDDGKEKEQHTSIKSVPGGTTKNESEVSSHLYVTIKKKQQQHKRGNREKTNSKKKIRDPNWAYQIQTETGFLLFWAP